MRPSVSALHRPRLRDDLKTSDYTKFKTPDIINSGVFFVTANLRLSFRAYQFDLRKYSARARQTRKWQGALVPVL